MSSEPSLFFGEFLALLQDEFVPDVSSLPLGSLLRDRTKKRHQCDQQGAIQQKLMESRNRPFKITIIYVSIIISSIK